MPERQARPNIKPHPAMIQPGQIFNPEPWSEAGTVLLHVLKRALATGADLLLLILGLGLGLFGLGIFLMLFPITLEWLVLGMALPALIPIGWIWLEAYYEASPGKRLFGLEMDIPGNEPVLFARLLVRNLLKWLQLGMSAWLMMRLCPQQPPWVLILTLGCAWIVLMFLLRLIGIRRQFHEWFTQTRIIDLETPLNPARVAFSSLITGLPIRTDRESNEQDYTLSNAY